MAVNLGDNGDKPSEATAVPAWKRAGLVHKASAKPAPKVLGPAEAKVKKSTANKDNENRAPKRQKVPKSERAPAPEPDQLVYLRQFNEDKANWKFSKQKQNWLIRNAFSIEESYGAALEAYITEIQGASRGRLIDDANGIVERWNNAMSEPELKSGAEAEETSNKDADAETAPNSKASSKNKASKVPVEANAPDKTKPAEYVARRAQAILKALTGDLPELLFLD